MCEAEGLSRVCVIERDDHWSSRLHRRIQGNELENVTRFTKLNSVNMDYG